MEYGGTKKGEYYRSADLFREICQKEDPYFALALLVDMQYDRQDMIEVLSIMKEHIKPKGQGV